MKCKIFRETSDALVIRDTSAYLMENKITYQYFVEF